VEAGGVSSCDRCLRRAELIGVLAPRIADGVRSPAERTRLLLALPDHELIRAVAPGAAGAIAAQLRRFDPHAFRRRMADARIEAICRHDPDYPEPLGELDDAPNPLFARGQLEALHGAMATPAVAIVGGRQASRYALEVAYELGRGLSVAGVPVVSGLALGVDAAAHRGTLAAGGRAIAVLASGADVPYPRRHRSLYEAVLERGAVLSEMPPGTQVRRWAFPARNRIMAALAKLVVVVEAAERSGSLITATFAHEIGRDVGAVPGRVNARSAAGSNRLIADGAAVVLGVEDILDRIFYAGARPAPPPAAVELEPAERAVLDAVEAGDSPLEAAPLGAKEVRAALGRLEMIGLVRRDRLGGYERTGLRCAGA
jgi:DNA processing protein